MAVNKNTLSTSSSKSAQSTSKIKETDENEKATASDKQATGVPSSDENKNKMEELVPSTKEKSVEGSKDAEVSKTEDGGLNVDLTEKEESKTIEGLTIADKEESDMGVKTVGVKVSANPAAYSNVRTQDEVRLATEIETQPAVYPPSMTPVPIGGENVQKGTGPKIIGDEEAGEGESLYVVQGGPIAPYGNGADAIEAHGASKARLYDVGETVSLSSALAKQYVKIGRLAPYMGDDE